MTTKPPRSEREYTCTTCGLSLDRDVNAAQNLAALARTLKARRTARTGHAVSCSSGVSDAGEASSPQIPTPFR